MKIKFNLDDNLPQSKMMEIHNLIVVRAVFHEKKKTTNIIHKFS